MSIPGLSITDMDSENIINLGNPTTVATSGGAAGIDMPTGSGMIGQQTTEKVLVEMPSSPIPPLDLGQPCLRGTFPFCLVCLII